MNALLELILAHGPLVVFANVMVEQLGVPIPAVPMLVVAGSLVADGRFPFALMLGLAMLGSGLANLAWFLAGRRFGRRVLRTVCRISLSPDVCVRETENIYARWGLAALLVARFVPGLSSVAAPLAGSMGMRLPAFMLFDALGTGLWAASALLAGMLFHRQVDGLLDALETLGGNALLVIGALFVAYLLAKWVQRLRLLRFVRAMRMPVEELQAMIDAGRAPVIVDVRSANARETDPRRIPGAIEAELADVQRLLAHVPRDREIVLYCACPNEASAAKATRALMRQGYRSVRPLAGGLDGWLARAVVPDQGAGLPGDPA